MGRGKQNIISVNTRFILSGNNRITPIDLSLSQAAGEEVRDESRIFETSLADYWRIDLGIRYIKNRPKTTSIIALNIQNLTSRENEAGRFFSNEFNSVLSETQLALFPNLSYRLEF